MGLTRLAARAIETRTLSYYSRHGQHIISDKRGRYAGYDWPQLSIHRADLHEVLLEAVRTRLGADAVQLSGHDGGTGASPWSSIKQNAAPWVVMLRSRIRCRSGKVAMADVSHAASDAVSNAV